MLWFRDFIVRLRDGWDIAPWWAAIGIASLVFVSLIILKTIAAKEDT